MKFIDLKQQYRKYKSEIQSEIDIVLESGIFINGPAISELESKLSAYIGVNNTIACSSGTDALILAMLALDLLPGDEVIIPDFSFFATAETVAFLGATPIFVDIKPDTFNIDTKLIENAISKKTKGIIPVSLFGQTADLDEINEIAIKNGLWVIEDGAQSFGAIYKGKKSCSMTTISTTSFFPAKPLGCYGDGGAIFTNDGDLAKKIRMLLNHGQRKRYLHNYIGMNARMDTIQAAVLNIKLNYFEEEFSNRQKIAQLYTDKLKDFVRTPIILDHNVSTWAQYTIRLKERDKLQKKLKENNIPTAIHYPIPLHKQKAFCSHKQHKHNFSNAEKVSSEVISLPMHAFLRKDDIEIISSKIKEEMI